MRTLPPTRSAASKTRTSAPSATSRCAADSPAYPAPTTATRGRAASRAAATAPSAAAAAANLIRDWVWCLSGGGSTRPEPEVLP